MRHLVLLTLAILLASCAVAGKLTTPSGNPEVTIANASLKEVKDAITQAMLNEGYVVEQSTDYALTFTRFEGGGYFKGANKNHQATFSIVEGTAGIRVIHSRSILTMKGSQYEFEEAKNTQEELDEQQWWLNTVASSIKRK